MAHETFAPWAELVPGIDHLMTEDELMALPADDGTTYELVEGRLVRMPPSGGGASNMAMSLGAALTNFVQEHGLGRTTGPDGEFVVSAPGEPITALAPDIAYVRSDRLPARDSEEWDRPWHLAPDLAVEMASPNQYRPEMAEKAKLYLKVGVRLVWVVWPKYKQVDVWRLGCDAPVATLNAGDQLDGLDVLPGFSYPLAELFA